MDVARLLGGEGFLLRAGQSPRTGLGRHPSKRAYASAGELSVEGIGAEFQCVVVFLSLVVLSAHDAPSNEHEYPGYPLIKVTEQWF